MYCYRRLGKEILYTVGHEGPGGQLESESDHTDREAAAARVHYLNGGNPPESEEDQLLRVSALILAGDHANPKVDFDDQVKATTWAIEAATELIAQVRQAGGVRSL